MTKRCGSFVGRVFSSYSLSGEFRPFSIPASRTLTFKDPSLFLRPFDLLEFDANHQPQRGEPAIPVAVRHAIDLTKRPRPNPAPKATLVDVSATSGSETTGWNDIVQGHNA